MRYTLSDGKVVARKVHRCELCSEPISVGSTYRCAKAVDDGAIYAWREHIACGLVAQEEWDGRIEGYGPDHFEEALSRPEAELDVIMAGCATADRMRVFERRERMMERYGW